MTTTAPARDRRAAFTLIELLTVIGIIVILIAILLPVVARVKQQAYVTSTQQMMNQIAGAVERYRSDTGAYPGPIANALFAPIGPGGITMTENLTLGLCGGWKFGGTYDVNEVGKGAASHVANAAKRTRLITYLDPTPISMMPNIPWTANGKTGVSDSVCPEFMDRFPEGKPVLYLRANSGATQAIGAGNTFQYDPAWLTPYFAASEVSSTDFPSRNGVSAGVQSYLIHPTIPNTPRGKDGFILISAGSDNKFGTKDDLFQ